MQLLNGMVDNINYSLIYHDHFSYFSVEPWLKFIKNLKCMLLMQL